MHRLNLGGVFVRIPPLDIFHNLFIRWRFSCLKLCRHVAPTYTHLLRAWVLNFMSGTSSSVLAKIINLENNCIFYLLYGACKNEVCERILIRSPKFLWLTEGDADGSKLQQGSSRPCYTLQTQQIFKSLSLWNRFVHSQSYTIFQFLSTHRLKVA